MARHRPACPTSSARRESAPWSTFRSWRGPGLGGTRRRSAPWTAADIERRLTDFTELVATAIANAQAHSELTASRARIVTTADQTRRRIERDLHDGAQQELVSLTLQLQTVRASLPPELDELATDLDRVAARLSDALDHLREIARGIHPAILAEGGLAPALKALARRSPVPVDLMIRAPDMVRLWQAADYGSCSGSTAASPQFQIAPTNTVTDNAEFTGG